jgi:hypothetical protein
VLASCPHNDETWRLKNTKLWSVTLCGTIVEVGEQSEYTESHPST